MSRTTRTGSLALAALALVTSACGGAAGNATAEHGPDALLIGQTLDHTD